MSARRYVAVSAAVVVALGVAIGVAPGVPRLTTNTPGILSGHGTTADPLAMSLTSDGTSITGTGSSGSALSVSAITSWRDSALLGVYGPGTDGTCAFDGSTVVAGITPASNIYLMPRDVFCADATVSSGVHVHTNGFRFFANGTLANSGRIDDDGADATAGTGTAGAARSAQIFGGTLGGSSGGGVHGTNATATSNSPSLWTTASAPAGGDSGGNGSNGTVQGQGGGGGGGGGAGGCSGANNFPGGNGGAIATALVASNGGETPIAMINGQQEFIATKYQMGTSGGGGGGTGAGGSGASGGYVFVGAKKITGSGAISANAGVSSAAWVGASSNGGGAGGSGGGIAVVLYNTNGGNTITATASAGRAGLGCGGTGGNGVDGVLYLFNLSGDGT